MVNKVFQLADLFYKLLHSKRSLTKPRCCYWMIGIDRTNRDEPSMNRVGEDVAL